MNSVAVIVRDFNADLRADLAVVDNFTNTLSVLAGYGDGVSPAATLFSTVGIGYSVAAGDFDQDGKPDLAITDAQKAPPTTLRILLSR